MCLSLRHMKHAGIDSVRRSLQYVLCMCFTASIIGYRVTEGHAHASVSSEYCLVKLFYVVMQFCLRCCQSASASACQGFLPACSVIKERA